MFLKREIEQDPDEDGKPRVQRCGLVVPDCCKQVKRTGAVFVTVETDPHFTGSPTPVAHWGVRWLEFTVRHYLMDQNTPWNQLVADHTPKFCPFCGTPLPELVPRELAPTHEPAADGDYCGTCEERSSSCKCWPLACRWKPTTEQA